MKRYLVQTVTDKDTAKGNTTTVKAARIAASGDCNITLPDDEIDMTNCPCSILSNAVGREDFLKQNGFTTTRGYRFLN